MPADLDEMSAAGWYVQPQLTFAGRPPTLHLTLGAATAPHVEEFISVLADAVATAVQAGPVQVDPGVADFVRALDPSALPERMAEVNALLDLAAPALREALLVAFLDRLSRPSPA